MQANPQLARSRLSWEHPDHQDCDKCNAARGKIMQKAMEFNLGVTCPNRLFKVFSIDKEWTNPSQVLGFDKMRCYLLEHYPYFIIQDDTDVCRIILQSTYLHNANLPIGEELPPLPITEENLKAEAEANGLVFTGEMRDTEELSFIAPTDKERLDKFVGFLVARGKSFEQKRIERATVVYVRKWQSD